MKLTTIEQIRKLAKPKKPRKKQADYLARFAATPPATELSDSERENQRGLFERHDRAVVSLRLPLAPSHNHYWRSWVRPGSTRVMTHVSTEGQAYQKAVAAAWRRHFNGWPPEPLTGRIRLLVVVHMARRGGDISNRIKPLEDALTACKVWLDDSHIDDLHPIRGNVVKPTGAMDVIIEVIEE